jgi:hypothetical protein
MFFNSSPPGYSASKWQRWGLNLSSLVLRVVLLSTYTYYVILNITSVYYLHSQIFNEANGVQKASEIVQGSTTGIEPEAELDQNHHSLLIVL